MRARPVCMWVAGPGDDSFPVSQDHLAIRQPGRGTWEIHEDVVITNFERVACGVQNVAIVGEQTNDRDVTRWREVDLQGSLVGETALPAGMAPGERATTEYFVGQATEFVGFVRSFEQIEEDHFYQIAVMSSPDAEPLVEDLSGDTRLIVARGAIRLPTGAVVVLVARFGEVGAGI